MKLDGASVGAQGESMDDYEARTTSTTVATDWAENEIREAAPEPADDTGGDAAQPTAR